MLHKVNCQPEWYEFRGYFAQKAAQFGISNDGDHGRAR
jgi:hypothetical protein